MTYKRIFDFVSPWRPDAHVFLKTSPGVCEERVARRGDSYVITADYMAKVGKFYDMYAKYTDIPVVEVCADMSVASVADAVVRAVAHWA